MKELFTYKNQIIMRAEGAVFSFGSLDVENNPCCCIACCKCRGGTVFL